jgi:hypothetical protein
MLGSGMVRGANRVAVLAWWGGAIFMIAVWHQWSVWHQVAVG